MNDGKTLEKKVNSDTKPEGNISISLDIPCVTCTEQMDVLTNWMSSSSSTRYSMGEIAVNLCKHCTYAPAKSEKKENHPELSHRLQSWMKFNDILSRLLAKYQIDVNEVKQNFKPIGVHQGRLYIMSNDTRKVLEAIGVDNFSPSHLLRLGDDVKVWSKGDLAIVTSYRRDKEIFYSDNGHGKKIETYRIELDQR